MNDNDDSVKIDHRVEGATIMPLFGESVVDLKLDPEKMRNDELPIITMSDFVLLPGMTMPISVGKESSLKVLKQAERCRKYVGIVTLLRSDDNLIDKVGTLAEVVKEVEMPEGSHSFFLQARRRFRVLELLQPAPCCVARVELLADEMLSNNLRVRALMSNIRDDIKAFGEVTESELPRELQFALANITDNTYMVNFLCSVFPMRLEQRIDLLECDSPFGRAVGLATIIDTELELIKIKMSLHNQTQMELTNLQRQHYLRTQIQIIQQELGESNHDVLDALLNKAQRKSLISDSAKRVFDKEFAKLKRTPEQSPDYSTIYSYLQTLVDLPWGYTTSDNLNLRNARRVLEHDHYGLDKVKERILEHLAVLKLRGDMKSPILCLVGPPGVGKTSLGRSIAKALKRKYVRVSFGGLHDEAEIRGHRRTYIGAMPGRIISGIQRAGTDNPVFVLDEIDKIASDFKGDPSSALLEVLDPEQNSTFHDNYLDVDYDLSKVLFIATANTLQTISGPLRDRMEIIDLTGYVVEEKVEIGERHLLPHQKEEHGLASQNFSIPKRTMEKIVELYTRESGVRLLDKQLAKVMRRVAWKVANDESVPAKLLPADLEDYLGKPDFNPEKYEGNEYAGVVTGLAWTSVGGVILEVESTLVRGKGGLTLTGNLGDVMKESAQLALLWVKANADDLGIDPKLFEQYTAHIHCPEGATPKDGPSAGITMVTSLVSTFTQRRVRARIAMTGEITLRGKVIPIGGVKEKILAAKRAGITDLVLCADNRKDVEEINELYTSGLTFHYVYDLHEVLDFALLPEQVKNAKTFKTT